MIPASPRQQRWQKALRDLFLSLFDDESLRSFLNYEFGVQHLVDELPGGHASLKLLSDRTVDLLEDHGLVGRPLFEELTRIRPNRQLEIDVVHELWQAAHAGKKGSDLEGRRFAQRHFDFQTQKQLTEALAQLFPFASNVQRVGELLGMKTPPEASQLNARLLWQKVVAEANRRQDETLEALIRLSEAGGDLYPIISNEEPTTMPPEARVDHEELHFAAERNTVFISYSHRDSDWLERLLTHLKPLVRRGIISTWTDREIRAGSRWELEIARSLDVARVAVLLVSANFWSSDFIVENELPTLLARAELGDLALCWVAIGSSLYQETDIAKFQAVNDPARPLDSLSGSDQEQALVEIARKIKGLLA